MFSRWSPCSCSTSPYSGCSTTVPLHANSFLHARTIFFRSYSDDRPCTVVRVLRPFRCWIRTWTSPSCTSSSELLIASANGSNVLRFWMDIRLNVALFVETKRCDTTHEHRITVTDNCPMCYARSQCNDQFTQTPKCNGGLYGGWYKKMRLSRGGGNYYRSQP